MYKSIYHDYIGKPGRRWYRSLSAGMWTVEAGRKYLQIYVRVKKNQLGFAIL